MATWSYIQKFQLDDARRMDAEYFASDQIFDNYFLGEQIARSLDYGTSEDLNEETRGYPTLRLNEFSSYFIIKPEKYCDRINEETFLNLKLKSGDVLICRTNGNPNLVGKSAVVMEDSDYAFASYLFRVKTGSEISPSTLVTYLHSRQGRAEIEKNMMISNQTNFSPARFRLIRVPKFTLEFQSEINILVKSAYDLSRQSTDLYLEAENLLLEELRLKDFQTSEDLSYVVNYSDTKEVERIDADYFQPKYEKLIAKIQSQKAKSLLEIVQDVPARFVPKPDEIYRYIELSNIDSSTGIIDGFSEVLGKEAPNRARRLLKSGDVIVSSIQGSLEKVALVGKEQDGNLASTGFFQFRSNKILPEVLLILARSVVLQWQLERECAGTILSAVPQESLKRLIIPTLSTETQKKIAELILQSHEAQNKSKELLEEAKRKVEEMIEKGGDKNAKESN